MKEDGGVFITNGNQHNHGNDFKLIVDMRLVSAVKRRVEVEGGALHRIFMEELARCVLDELIIRIRL